MLRISTTMNLHPSLRDDLGVFLREGIDFYKAAGYDALDINLALIRNVENWQPILEDAVAYAAERGLRFELCHLPFGVKIGATDEEAAPFNERVHTAIEAAKVLGVDHAVAHPNTTSVPRAAFNAAAERESVLHHLAPFIEHGRAAGVDVVIENMRQVPSAMGQVHRYCGEVEELCDVADALGASICWDFGHANINGLRQSDSLKYIGKRLAMLHVNDNFGVDDEHVPPFCGKIDWADAMDGLRAVGFTGLINFEVACRLPAAARRSFAEMLAATGRVLGGMASE